MSLKPVTQRTGSYKVYLQLILPDAKSQQQIAFSGEFSGVCISIYSWLDIK